jgi:hypothetical protein
MWIASLVLGAQVVASAATHSTTSPGAAALAHVVEQARQFARSGRAIFFRDCAYELVRAHGDDGIAALCMMYDEPDARSVRSTIICTLAVCDAPGVRSIMLRVAAADVMELSQHTFPFFSEHFGKYAAPQRAQIAQLAREALAKPSDLPAIPWTMEVVGLGDDPADVLLVRKAAQGQHATPGAIGACRRVLSRLGDPAARRQIIASLDARDGEVVATAVRDIRYGGDPRDIGLLTRFITDKRLGPTWRLGLGASDVMGGWALDALAARAIHSIAAPRPTWKLTAPDGVVRGTGRHPDAYMKMVTATRVGAEYVTLSQEQTDEVLAWAKEYTPPTTMPIHRDRGMK